MAKFVPIADVDAYVKSLKREGFFTDLQIADIRKKHQDALDAQKVLVEKKLRDRTLKLEKTVLEKVAQMVTDTLELTVNNVWECNVKVRVRKDGSLKIETVFPFAEFDHWMRYKSEHKPPMMTMVRCLKMAGAPRSACEQVAARWVQAQ
jgi:hypothetical protein